jgi:hypothetical protein
LEEYAVRFDGLFRARAQRDGFRRYWRAFSNLPPPPELRALLERVYSGRGLYLHVH